MSAPGMHFVTRALHWLRAGYPQGIPQHDYIALLGVLHRSLTDTEVESIVDDLAAQAENGHKITGNDVRAMIRRRVHEQAAPEDVERVTLRLVRGGWPLAGELRKEYGLTDGPAPLRPHGSPTSGTPGDPAAAATATATVMGTGSTSPAEELVAPARESGTQDSLLVRLVAWLRQGYPTGVPEQDYIPLLALLQRRLTSEEVTQVAMALRSTGTAPAGPDDISTAISAVTLDEASAHDMARVREHLMLQGWPVSFPDLTIAPADGASES